MRVALVLLLLLATVYGVLPDSDFFSGLDLDLPQLAKVKEFYQSNNITGAKSALVEYYKTRTYPKWYFNPLVVNKSSVTPDKSAADTVVAGYINSVSIVYKFPNGSDINWFYNPTGGSSKYPYDPEWQWQINRMGWWPTLGQAWWGLGTDVYAQTFVNEMESWVINCPVPADVNQSDWSAWRTIEAGIRVSTSWPDAWNRFLTSEYFDVDAAILMLKSFMDHGNYLYQFHTSGNWLTMEMNGLFTTGALFPEFARAKEWREYAAFLLYNVSGIDFLPDGMWNELTTGYDQVSIDNCLQLWQVAAITNTTDDVPGDFVNVLHNAFVFNVKLMCPAGDLPLVNDAWVVDVGSQCDAGLPYFPTDPYLIWCASRRSKGSPPPFTSIWLNSSNYIAMRTGWGFTDTYALFDVAALGARHYHQDKLNLIIDVYGRKMLYDGGGGPYEDSRYRDFAVDTPSHNTILIDNLPQRRAVPTAADPMGSGNPDTPKPSFQTNDQFDYASGVYMDPYGSTIKATHKREVLFVKQQILSFVVVDTVTPQDTKSHSYQALWNLKTTHFVHSEQMVASNDTDLPNLAVYALISDTTIQTFVSFTNSTTLLGWDVDRNPPFYLPALEIVHGRAATGTVQFITFLLPLASNETPSVTGITSSNNNQEFSITFKSGQNMDITLVPGGGIKAVISSKDDVTMVISAGTSGF